MRNLLLKEFRKKVLIKMTTEEKKEKMNSAIKEIDELNIDSKYFHEELNKLRARI